MEFAVDAEEYCCGRYHQRFCEKRKLRIEMEALFDGSVNGKAGADDDGHDREYSIGKDQISDADHCKDSGQLFQAVHFFMEYNDADHRNDNGFQKIAEAGVQHVTGIDGVDIYAPVDADEDPA